MLNKAPNNNDVTHVANIMLNKVPDSNEFKRIVKSVCLTTKGTQQLSMVAI